MGNPYNDPGPGAAPGLPSSGGSLTGPLTVPSLTITGAAAHRVLIGQGAGPVTSAPAGTTGQVLTSQGAGVDPIFTGAVSGIIGFAGINPVAPAGTTVVMMGMGAAPGNCTFTPTRNGRMLLIFTGHVINPINAVAGSGCGMGMFYGTGTPPANNAAQTGTALNSPVIARVGLAQGASFQDTRPFTLVAVVNALLIGTTYWVDIGANQTVAGGTAALQSVNLTFMEQ